MLMYVSLFFFVFLYTVLLFNQISDYNKQGCDLVCDNSTGNLSECLSDSCFMTNNFTSNKKCPIGYSYHIVYANPNLEEYCFRIVQNDDHAGVGRQECRVASDGYLAVMNNTRELALLKTLYELTKHDCQQIWVNGYVRAGLNKSSLQVDIKGKERSMTVTDWAFNQPYSNGTFCVMAYQTLNWKWAAVSCNSIATCYACETDVIEFPLSHSEQDIHNT